MIQNTTIIEVYTHTHPGDTPGPSLTFAVSSLEEAEKIQEWCAINNNEFVYVSILNNRKVSSSDEVIEQIKRQWY